MLIPLRDLQDRDLPRAGSKAVRLGRLLARGLPVPDGFCVPSDAYEDHLRRSGALAAAKRLLRGRRPPGDEERGRILEVIRRRIVEAMPSAALSSAVEAGLRGLSSDALAVRSSASCEDGADRSFAGMHDSILGVRGTEDCLVALRRCWASLWSDRAVAYREQARVPHRDVSMAVIVQELVPANASGVLFTADPVTGRDDRIVVESCAGLGEALVAGRAAPERAILSRPGLEVAARASAPRVTSAPETVVEGGEGSDGVASPGLLDDDRLRRLATLALEVEGALGFRTDVEWAVAGDRAFILQARPIPRTGVPEDRRVFSNVNTGEVVPDPVTPASWSVVEPLVGELLGVILGRMGIRLEGRSLVGLVAGRVYFDLTLALACVKRIPFVRPEDIVELLGGKHQMEEALGDIRIEETDLPRVPFSWWKAIRNAPGLLVDYAAFSERRAARVVDRVRREADRALRIDPRALPDAALVGRVEETGRDLLGGMETIRVLGVAGTYAIVLYRLCKRWFGEDGPALASRLIAGLGTNDNAQAGVALFRLASSIRARPLLEQTVMRAKSFESLAARIRGTPDGERFLEGWRAFLRDHGHHCRGEIEVGNPRWWDEPDLVLEQLRSYASAAGDEDFLSRYGRLDEDRSRAEEQCLARLRGPIRRAVFRRALRLARKAVPVRENVKNQLVRRIAAARRMLLELDRRMIRRGQWDRPGSIFFLRIDEIGRVVRSEAGPEIRDLIEGRRSEHDRNLALVPPPVVRGGFRPESAAPPPPAGGARTLTGISVSPGTATGPARVIRREGRDRVLPGEVLVVPFTDPGWTLFFPNAAAIVADMGGLLSHGSIIAREYGIPTVVNVGCATTLIRTGQRVRVDANRGVVEILEPAPGEGAAPNTAEPGDGAARPT